MVGKYYAGLPCVVDSIPIYSPTLSDIVSLDDFEYEKLYGFYLYICTLENFTKVENLINENEEYEALFLQALFFYTKIKFKRMDSRYGMVFVNDKMMIHGDNYELFSKHVRYANGIMTDDEKAEEDDKNDKVKKLLAKKKAFEEKLKKQKADSGEALDIVTLASTLSVMDGNNLNILNVWNLNIVQFKDQLHRCQMKESFYLTIEQLLAGADPTKVEEPVHYMKNLNKTN